ncbi:MerR family DNA-binding transcriptional regulator, partial [Mumia sp.]
MRVGELAELTGVAPRMLRYYEEQGLLVPPRQDNGYRSYGEEHV